MMHEGCNIVWGILDLTTRRVLGTQDNPDDTQCFTSTDAAKVGREEARKWCPHPLGIAYVQTVVRMVQEPEPKKVEHVEPAGNGKVAKDTPIWGKSYPAANH